jgi:mono/diheme cytochrome c family protein
MSNSDRQTVTNKTCGALLLLICASLGAGCRQDMHDQPKYKPYRIFESGETPRAPVEGTIPRGYLKEDAGFHTGRSQTPGVSATTGTGAAPPSYVTTLPMALTESLLNRGEERFNIYCSPCHGRLGDGEGMVVKRGFRRPPSFHIDRLRAAPAGYFFDVMTNGFGAMPDYAGQITPNDRWAIVAYVKALQLSQNAALADLTPEERSTLGAKEQKQ